MSRPEIQPPTSQTPELQCMGTVPFSAKESKITPYVYHVLVTEHGIAATASKHEVKLFDASRLEPLHTVGYHDNTITQIRARDQHLVVTSSKDQAVSAWDLRIRPAQAVLRIKLSLPILTFDISGDSNVLATGSEWSSHESKIELIDFRSTKPLHEFTMSHSDDITCVNFSPFAPTQLLSASTDGLLSIFDVTKSEEDEALIGSANINASVSQANYFGPGSEYIFSMTDMETLALWNAELTPIVDFGDMRVMDQQGFELDYMINGRYSAQSDRFYVTMGSDYGDIHVLNVQLGRIEVAWVMKDGHSEIVRDVDWDDSRGYAVSGSEDGNITLWRAAVDLAASYPAAATTTRGEGSTPKSQPSGPGATAGGKHTRFSPY
ncbi:hypothetical protein EV182_000194 [Spiromyces aspiralis]|uniref:Uncharacterized protein n=1 Tax=Spiromyces aspiralis TaxID=68401 RepID=A0ACC1HHZ4_9FUNG|nr:hypothetical protein EV182_000194 [Spiromyces aspiralis]